MSIEEANKSRFERGLMKLTELEGELLIELEALAGMLGMVAVQAMQENYSVLNDIKNGFAISFNNDGIPSVNCAAFKKAYGHD